MKVVWDFLENLYGNFMKICVGLFTKICRANVARASSHSFLIDLREYSILLSIFLDRFV